tara:strand:- start:395 stop:679 length:285 start_codon:yes stop_codon:yes gene_type:complete
MPTEREREYYRLGIKDGMKIVGTTDYGESELLQDVKTKQYYKRPIKKKRKLSAWNKFVKANSKKPRFRMRSGKLNLKKMAVAFRKTPAGKKKRR